MSSGRGLVLWAGFIGSVMAVYYAVKATYPDRPSAPKEYPGGLDEELGGPGAARVCYEHFRQMKLTKKQAFKAGDEL